MVYTTSSCAGVVPLWCTPILHHTITEYATAPEVHHTQSIHFEEHHHGTRKCSTMMKCTRSTPCTLTCKNVYCRFGTPELHHTLLISVVRCMKRQLLVINKGTMQCGLGFQFLHGNNCLLGNSVLQSTLKAQCLWTVSTEIPSKHEPQNSALMSAGSPWNNSPPTAKTEPPLFSSLP